MPDEGVVYVFTPAQGACDTCAAMAGEYPVRPARPHKNCKCVIWKKVAGRSCTREVRNPHILDEYTYTLEQVLMHFTPEDADRTMPVNSPCSIQWSDFDESFGDLSWHWSPPCISETVEVTLPARTEGDIVAEIEYSQIQIEGELWEVCYELDPAAGYQLSERYIGQVGGIAISQNGIAEAHVEALP